MGRDSDDRLLSDGVGLNCNHEKRVQERLKFKPFLSSFDYDTVNSPRFHYTSPEGLMGILKTRTFFFTDSQFLNDFREKVNINKELDIFWFINRKKYDKRFFSLLSNIRITQYEDSGFSYIDNFSDKPCRYFVLSLSTDGDNLSMWKYYSKSGNYNGYCISLFDAALTDEWIDRITGAAVISGKVEYFSKDKQDIILQTVERLYSIWQSYDYSNMLDDKIAKEFTSWMSVEALFFKDECFADERETRYVAIVPTDALNDLYYEYKGNKYKMYDFRIVNGMFIPYIKMPFNDYNKSVCWAINSICIGPSGDDEQKEVGLRQFICSLDYEFEKCPIIKSTIPVRY